MTVAMKAEYKISLFPVAERTITAMSNLNNASAISMIDKRSMFS